MTFKGILFDKDGTLFKFQESWGNWILNIIDHLTEGCGANRYAMAEVLKFNIEKKVFLPESKFIAGTNDELLDLIAPFSNSLKGKELRNFIYQKSFDVDQIPVTDLISVFDNLKRQKVTLGLATNDAELPARTQLSSAGILEYFDFVVGCDSGFGSKPNSGQLSAFCKKFDFLPSQVAMIGDSTHDLRAAKKIGMFSIGVLTGVASKTELADYADKIFLSIEAFPEWLEGS